MKKHIVISGSVQGVGFRYWLYKAALQNNINGWVKNKISGEVEALLIGNDSEIDNLIKLCKKGPSSSKVTSIIVQDYQKEYSGKYFDVRKQFSVKWNDPKIRIKWPIKKPILSVRDKKTKLI